MIKQLAHLCIHTRNLDETLRFYTEALGLEIGFDFERNGALFGAYLGIGNRTFIEVFEGDPGTNGAIAHFALEVDDIDVCRARLEANGVELGEKRCGADHTWQAWLKDPNGVRIELHQYTDKSLQFTGGTCIVDW